jgi:cell division protein ZapA (FtsZ GTPase activity inhibitor)
MASPARTLPCQKKAGDARLLAALADGLNQKQACLACGIGETTLRDWKELHPGLEERMTEVREQARQKALAAIKAAGESDWRAASEFLKLSFQADYRRPDTHIGVDVNATAGSATIVCTEEQRQRLIELRERLQNGERKMEAK